MGAGNGQGQHPGLIVGPHQGLGLAPLAAFQTHSVLPGLVISDIPVVLHHEHAQHMAGQKGFELEVEAQRPLPVEIDHLRLVAGQEIRDNPFFIRCIARDYIAGRVGGGITKPEFHHGPEQEIQFFLRVDEAITLFVHDAAIFQDSPDVIPAQYPFGILQNIRIQELVDTMGEPAGIQQKRPETRFV